MPFLPLFFLLLLLLPFQSTTSQQLPRSETRILLHIQKLLEYPAPLSSWTNWTNNFCYLPSSPSLRITCINSHVTELTIVGNQTSPSQLPNPIPPGKQYALSGGFSIDSLFTDLTKLPNLQSLSLVKLGIWGQLPSEKVNRFQSIRVLNLSSNFISGPIGPVGPIGLKSLVLADNLMTGTVPDLTGLASSLQEVNLSRNLLRSQIPSGFKRMNSLQILDLSGNKLIGPIPFAIFDLPLIRFIDLNKNQLSGTVASKVSCSSQLQLLDISNNLLVGSNLPACSDSSKNRRVIASWNCLSGGGKAKQQQQHPYSFCRKEALAVKPPNKGKSGNEKASRVGLGVIIGIVGGALGLTVVLGIAICLIVRRSNYADLPSDDRRFEPSLADKMSIRSSVHTFESRRVPKTMRSAAIGLPSYHNFTLEEIEDATNGFDPLNFIGEEVQGQLYKGCLVDGLGVLVKCVKLKHKSLSQNVMQHIEVLSKLRHLNLVSVLGHCIVTFQDHPTTVATLFVVFEHVTNGSLLEYLTDRRKKEVLKWPQRMAITMGVARGIHFLHTGVAPGIFGNDLKIENVLLDESLTAKLSNYTLPLPSKVGMESPLRGQDIQGSENPEKEDVYQLGTIVLQLITGKHVRTSGEVEELKIQMEKGLSEGESKLRAMADPYTKGTYAYDSVRTAVEITVNCLSKDPSSRPSIEDVLWKLQYSSQVQEGWTSSGNLGTS
ncbi:Probable LRR receptor-like serine/threonine-protein kinase At1g14390 [Linum grandiflorum]